MGYRSDVKLILTDKGMSMLKAKIPKSMAEERRWEVEPIYEAIKICDDKYWLLEWYDIKWYDNWPEYKVPCAVSDLRRELQAMDEPYAYMRSGEDYTDVEDEYYGYGANTCVPYLYLKREIEVDY